MKEQGFNADISAFILESIAPVQFNKFALRRGEEHISTTALTCYHNADSDELFVKLRVVGKKLETKLLGIVKLSPTEALELPRFDGLEVPFEDWSFEYDNEFRCHRPVPDKALRDEFRAKLEEVYFQGKPVDKHVKVAKMLLFVGDLAYEHKFRDIQLGYYLKMLDSSILAAEITDGKPAALLLNCKKISDFEVFALSMADLLPEIPVKIVEPGNFEEEGKLLCDALIYKIFRHRNGLITPEISTVEGYRKHLASLGLEEIYKVSKWLTERQKHELGLDELIMQVSYRDALIADCKALGIRVRKDMTDVQLYLKLHQKLDKQTADGSRNYNLTIWSDTEYYWDIDEEVMLRAFNEAHLGTAVNEYGSGYGSIYDLAKVTNRIIRAKSTNTDVWDQTIFCSRKKFEQDVRNGFARAV